MSKNQKNILVAPLDWGLGHATRCIPIIKQLLALGHQVWLAGDGRSIDLLKKEFPRLTVIPLQGYEVRYAKSKMLKFKLLFQTPRLFNRIKLENQELQEIIKEHKIDVVISDNRFGLYSDEVKSIFITHQVNIKVPFMKRSINKINRSFIEKYDECWVPDFENVKNNLTGSLSHHLMTPKNVKYIGPISRFDEQQSTESYKYDLCVVLSGPEPQRSILERKIIEQLDGKPLKYALVRGIVADEIELEEKENSIRYNYLPAYQLQKVMLSSKLVVCRSGYSTIMDLIKLKKSAVFIPTPGQTEQEYLAKYNKRFQRFYFESQDDFDLNRMIERSSEYSASNDFNEEVNQVSLESLLSTI